MVKKIVVLSFLASIAAAIFCQAIELVVPEIKPYHDRIGLSNDGKFLAVGGRTAIQLFNPDLQLLRNYQMFSQGFVASLYITNDSKTLIVSSTYGSVRMFELETGILRSEFQLPKSGYYGTAFVDEKNQLIIVPNSYYGLMWYDMKGTQVKTKQYPEIQSLIKSTYPPTISDIIVGSEDKDLICTAADNIVFAVDREGDLQWYMSSGISGGNSIGRCPVAPTSYKGSELAYLSLNGRKIVYLDRNGTPKHTLSVSFARHFACSSKQGYGMISYEGTDLDNTGMRLINMNDGQVLDTYEDIFGNVYYLEALESFLVLSQNRLTLVGMDGVIKKDVSSANNDFDRIYAFGDDRFVALGEDLVCFDLKDGMNVVMERSMETEGDVYATCVSPDGSLCAIAGDILGSEDAFVEIYDNELKHIKTMGLANRDIVCGIAISPDNLLLATISYSDQVDVWERATGKNLASFTNGHIGDTSGITFAPDGRSLYFKFSSKANSPNQQWTSNQIKQMDLSGRVLNTFTAENNLYLSISPDGQSLIGRGWSSTSVYSLDGKLIRNFEGTGGLAFTDDGKYVVTGQGYRSGKNTYNIIDFKTGAVKKRIQNTDERTGSIALAKGNSVLLSLVNNRITLFDFDSGDMKMHLFLLKNGWVTTDPNGYFDGSGESVSSVYWIKDLSPVELDQLFEIYYRPNLLTLILSGTDAISGETSLASVLATHSIPVVKIIKPTMGQKVDTSFVDVEILVETNGSEIDELRLYQNGKRIVLDGRGLSKVNTGSFTRSFTISLLSGMNTISAVAVSKERIESKKAEVSVFYSGGSSPAVLYLVAVGINEYANGSINLSYARADAETVKSAFCNNSQSLFSDVKPYLLTDKDANKSNILMTLDQIASLARPQDLLVFYFSGHGTVFENRYYLLSCDSKRLFDEADLSQNAILINQLNDKFSSIKALKQLVIIDACQSAAAAQAFAFRGAVQEKAWDQLSRSAGIHVMASANTDQYATEMSVLGHGVFTYTLLNGLRGNADGAPKDGKLTVYELKAYLDDQVPMISKQYKGLAQWPYTFSKGQDFPIMSQ
jgi:WD40 repeat protein